MSRPCSPARATFACLAEIAGALAHEHRLEILEHLGQGQRSVETVAKLTGLSIANASQHLQQLKRVGLVAAQREGKRILYRVADEVALARLLAPLRGLTEGSLTAMDRIQSSYFRDRDGMEPVSRIELMARLRRGRVTLLDVRPQEEFALGHLPKAINIPLAALERRLAELPRRNGIVAYCRGPYCVLSFEAVAALRARGYKVRRLEDGFPEWKAAGLPIEQRRAA